MANRRKKQIVRRRQYTDEEKAAAVEDARKTSTAAAARKHRIPLCNVSRWRKKADEAATKSNQGRSKHPRRSMNKAPSREKSTRRRASETAPSPTKHSHQTTPATGSAKKTSRRVGRRYTPSQIAQALESAARKGVAHAADELGMSRFSIYEWRRKAAKAAQGQGPSPTSGPDLETIQAQRDQEILAECRRHPGLGPSQIRNQLRRKNIKVSVQTVRRVMEDDGYRPPKVKRQPHDKTFEAVRPNHLWHLDYVHRFINRADAHTLILLDDCSRFVTGHGVDDAERADLVIQTFEEAVERHGKPEMVIHDRGSAFWSWRGISRFTQLLTELGVDQIVAKEKEWNGKLENFNGNLHTELFDPYKFYDLAEMKRRLTSHLHWYNHSRTHHSLGGGLLVPADRYYGRTQEVLAQIEAGHGRDLKEYDLRDRRMELFKLVTEKGVPELWLMGHRLLRLTD